METKLTPLIPLASPGLLLFLMLWPRVYWQARCACMPAAAGRLRLSTVQY